MTGRPRFLSALPALVVREVGAAVAWYRDVLGFRLPEAYAGSDEFAIVDLAPGQGVHLRRGAAPPAWRRTMGVHVLLEGQRLEALAARLAGISALVSPPGDQPWGMRELRAADPDGHLVRIAAPLDRELPAGAVSVAPEIPVADPVAAHAFCRDVLGMGPPVANPASPYFQRCFRDHANLHWWAASSSPFTPTLVAPRNRARGKIWDVCIEVEAVDALAAEMAGRGAEIQRGPVTTEYGIRELDVAGPEGCTISFGEDLGAVTGLLTP